MMKLDQRYDIWPERNSEQRNDRLSLHLFRSLIFQNVYPNIDHLKLVLDRLSIKRWQKELNVAFIVFQNNGLS